MAITGVFKNPAIFLIVEATILAGPVAADQGSESNWDVAVARGKGANVDFTTDEGTWMSVDIAPNGRWLVFDLLGHIYRLSSEGGEARCLTDGGIAVNYHPRISPDGEEIAFVSDRSGQDNLWIMRADGTGARPVWLDEATRSVEPTWTPDGRSILFTRRMRTELGLYRTNDRIWMVPREGGEGRLVFGSDDPAPLRTEFDGDPRYQWPNVSPDNRYVYFTRSTFAGDDRRIQRLDLQTGQLDSLTETLLDYTAGSGRPPYPALLGEFAPEVSPDDKWLAFARRIPGAITAFRGHEYVGRTALWVRNLHTGDERLLMDPITIDGITAHPPWNTRVLPGYAWSRDAQSISVSQGGKLWRVEVPSGKVHQIPFRARVRRHLSEMARAHITIDDKTLQLRAFRWPTSSPDGKHLVFEAIGQLWIMNLPSGRPRPLTQPAPEGVELTPAWSPDGRWVAYTTWQDGIGGHVYKINAKEGKRVQLTTDAATYLWPSWSSDGKTVLANMWPNALSRPPSAEPRDPQWEQIRIDADHKVPPTTVFKENILVENGEISSGRIFFVSPLKTESMPKKMDSLLTQAFALNSVRSAGGGRRVEGEIRAFVTRAAPSPDGNWLALEWRQDVYLMPLRLGSSNVVLDPHSEQSGVRRLSTTGGYFPRWRNAHVVEFTSGPEYHAHDTRTGRTTVVPLHLSVPRATPSGIVALVHARVVTLDKDRRILENASVVVRAGRIVCVGKCSTDDADRVFDLNEKTIVPGFVEHHAHHLSNDLAGLIPRQRWRSAVYLAYGVTTALDPATSNKVGFTIGEMVEAGRIIGPRTYQTGDVLLCMDEGAYDTAERDIRSLTDAQEHVDRQAKLGAVAIKDYKLCTRTARSLIAEAARRRGVSVIAEAGDLVYNLGLIMGGHTGWEHPLQHVPTYKDVSAFLGHAGAHHTPNHIISDFPHGLALEYWLSLDDRWNDPKVQLWFPWQHIAGRRTFVKKPLREYIFPILAEASADIKRAGGYIAIGDHGEFNGLSYHWELWSNGLAMKPMEVLEAASLDTAHYIGMEHEIGSIETGKLADLVVLNSNPLENIRNTIDIALVMKAGRLYDATTLDEIWPRTLKYGLRPWHEERMFKTQLRDDGYFSNEANQGIAR